MEKVHYWHVLQKFSLDMFLTRYCNVHLFQYKLKEIYIAWENVLKSWHSQPARAVSAGQQRGDIQTRQSTGSSLTQLPGHYAGAALPTQVLLSAPNNISSFTLQCSNAILLIFTQESLRNLCFCVSIFIFITAFHCPAFSPHI